LAYKNLDSLKWKFSFFVLIRYTGSIILIIGYFVLLNVDVLTGVVLRLIGNSMCLPWAIKNKVWDFVGLLSFFLALELHKFLGMVFGF
jgi:hypothetical protein